MKISVIGIGRLGGALAVALREKGFEIENLIVRGQRETARIVSDFIEPKPQILKLSEIEEINSDAIFITTQDAEIETVAENLAVKIKNKPLVFHTSGALSSGILNELKTIGCATGSLHPLVSVSNAVSGAKRFAGVFFCVEGDEIAVEKAVEIVARLGGKSFAIETEYKTLYHASAVTASGHLVALLDVALEMLTRCGLDELKSRSILLPLVKSVVENLETQTTAQALTGTFARADAETLRRQIDALTETVSAEALEVFLQLGLRSLHLAKRQNARPEKLDQMRSTILLAKKNIKC